MERYGGAVSWLASVPVIEPLACWATAIDFEDWPQQTRLDDGLVRPAMAQEAAWHGMGEVTAPYLAGVLSHLPGTRAGHAILTVVMPGHGIPPHTDAQGAAWRCRVHIPLTTNAESQFVVDGEAHHMDVGSAYIVNTEAEHSVVNGGSTPRIHLMFDVYERE